MKQSQKNIQIVKVQVGDVRKKRKVKRKTKGKKRSEVFSGTGLAPVLGQTQYFTPPMFPTSRAGTQFEPPKLQVVEKKEDPLKDAEMSLDQLKKLQDYMKGKGEAPSPFNVPSSAPPSPFEAGSYWNQYLFSDTPPRPIERPQQPLVSAEASSSANEESNFNLSKPFTRANLRPLTFKQLDKLRKQLGLGLPVPLPSDKNAGLTLKEGLIEMIVGYRPPF